MAATPSYDLTIETDQTPGSFGERFEDISRNYVEGYRSRSIGNYGVPTQIIGKKFYSSREEAETDKDSIEAKIGQDIMLIGTEGVANPETLFQNHVRLIEALIPTAYKCFDSIQGNCFVVDMSLTVQRMA